MRQRAAEPPERPGSVPARPALVPALIAAVRDAAGTMVYICGFVVFFLVLLRVMGRVTGLSHPVLSGAVELTQGILALPHTRRGFVWAAGLLGWGGLSVHGQSAAVLSGTDLPMGPYLAAKAAHLAPQKPEAAADGGTASRTVEPAAGVAVAGAATMDAAAADAAPLMSPAARRSRSPLR